MVMVKEKAMTTRERLIRYRQLLRTSEAEARNFLKDNRHDKRFASLVALGRAFLAAFSKYFEKH